MVTDQLPSLMHSLVINIPVQAAPTLVFLVQIWLSRAEGSKNVVVRLIIYDDERIR